MNYLLFLKFFLLALNLLNTALQLQLLILKLKLNLTSSEVKTPFTHVSWTIYKLHRHHLIRFVLKFKLNLTSSVVLPIVSVSKSLFMLSTEDILISSLSFSADDK